MRSIVIAVVLLALCAVCVNVAVAEGTKKKSPTPLPAAWGPKPVKTNARPRPCRSGGEMRRQIAAHQIIYNRYRRLRGLPPAVPREPAQSAGCSYVRWVDELWRDRAWQAKRAYRTSIVSRLTRGLRGSPMEEAASSLERQGRRYGVSPFFMAAVAATESSLGRAACSNNRFNVWGLANCDGRWYVPSFGSWDQAIAFYARFLSSRWPSASSPYHYHGYAKCDDCWGRKTSIWMRSLFGVPPITTYE